MSDHTETSDRVLGARIKASDHAAFKALFYRYYEPLFRFVARRLPAGEAPQDVVQDVFARLWQRRAAIKEDQPLKAYLYRIANNLLIDHYRKLQVRQAYVAQHTDTTPTMAPVEHVDLEDGLAYSYPFSENTVQGVENRPLREDHAQQSYA